jgi:hypothetical protein
VTIRLMYPQPSPFELEMLGRQEQEARERLHSARERYSTDDGDIPHEHHELIGKLEAEWKELHERLRRARER